MSLIFFIGKIVICMNYVMYFFSFFKIRRNEGTGMSERNEGGIIKKVLKYSNNVVLHICNHTPILLILRGGNMPSN